MTYYTPCYGIFNAGNGFFYKKSGSFATAALENKPDQTDKLTADI